MNTLNQSLLDSIQEIDECVMESEMNVCMGMLEEINKAGMLMEYAEPEVIQEYEIIQEGFSFSKIFKAIGNAIHKFIKNIKYRLASFGGGFYVSHKVMKTRKKIKKVNEDAKKAIKKGTNVIDVGQQTLDGYRNIALGNIDSILSIARIIGGDESSYVETIKNVRDKVDSTTNVNFMDLLVKARTVAIKAVNAKAAGKGYDKQINSLTDAAKAAFSLASKKPQDGVPAEEVNAELDKIVNITDGLLQGELPGDDLPDDGDEEGGDKSVTAEEANKIFAQEAPDSVKHIKPFIAENGGVSKNTFNIPDVDDICKIIDELHNLTPGNAVSKIDDILKKFGKTKAGKEIKAARKISPKILDDAEKECGLFIAAAEKFGEGVEADVKAEYDKNVAKLNAIISSKIAIGYNVINGINKVYKHWKSYAK